MDRAIVGVAWYRFRAAISRRWGGYLTAVLLIALLGGVAMGAVAGARRTQSAFPAYLAATNASNLQVQVYVVGNNAETNVTLNLTQKLERLPDVEHVSSAPFLFLNQLGTNGAPITGGANSNGFQDLGSVGGMYFTQDRVVVTQGRMANPKRADEMVATSDAARVSGWHLGQTITFGAFTVQQAIQGFSSATKPLGPRFSLKLVGLVVFSSQVVHDDVDGPATNVLLTPALTQRLRNDSGFPLYGLRLKDGNRDVSAVEREITRLLPPGATYTFHVTSVVENQVQRATKPEAIALGAFGAIAALAALIIGGLAISRELWTSSDDADILKALGTDPATRTTDAILGPLSAVLLGSLLAVGVAVALSPLTPIGPSRQVNPTPGIAFDWTVLLAGFIVLAVGLGALTAVLAYRRTSRPFGERSEPVARRSSVVNAAARAGLPAPAVAGLRFSLERGSGRAAAPVRSALVGAVLAVTVVVATVTFANSLGTLDSHPALYGWNWSYAITSVGNSGNVPPEAGRLLDRDPDVAAWSGFNFANAQIDGQTVPILLINSHAAISPPILSGHPVDASNQVVLGAATLAALHKKVGDTVLASYGSPQDAPVYVPPTRLLVVGTATMPTLGNPGSIHPSMGTGALIPKGIEPLAMRQALTQPDPNLNGPTIDVVRLRSGVKPSVGRASIQRIADAVTKLIAADPNGGGATFTVLGVQRPAEIVNYQSTGATPAILASGLAIGAVVALGLTLTASVRRRRRDLALLKALGFTQRQLASAVSWQASFAAVIGVIVGVPLGIALGRWLWDLFARSIYAVPAPSVPVAQVLAVVAGTLLLANLVAAIPGRIAARTPTALVLRAE